MSLTRGAVRACALLVVCAAAADRAPPKRAESELMSPVPFVLGSRYGRSEPRLMAPRNDRFFMGSRYGKRSEPRPPPAALTALPAALTTLLCEPAALPQLYRCTRATDYRRLEDEREPGLSSEED